MVITGRKVLKAVAVIAGLAVIIFVVVEVANGVPIAEVFTENFILFAALLPLFVVFLVSDEKMKDQRGEEQEQVEDDGA